MKRALAALGLRGSLKAATAWGVFAACLACSRTDDPLERFASNAPGPGRGGGSHTGASSSGAAAGAAAGSSVDGGSGNLSGTAGTTSGGGGDSSGGNGAGGDGELPPDFGCGPAPVLQTAFTREALRAAAADCATWHYCRFEGGALELRDETLVYVDAPSPQTLSSAQKAFAQAMSLWSVVELFQFGPVASSAISAGKDEYRGQGLREQIHSWYLTSRCRVEEQVINRKFATNIDDVLVSGRGMFGLDYLLYYPGIDTACPAASMTTQTWVGLSEEELRQRKQAYAAALSEDVLRRAGAIRQAWSETGGNFREDFVSGSGYPDEHQAMKVMAWSLIYLEREVKDWKLGIPAGYTVMSPVTLPESPYSGLLTENVRANLRGFRSLFQGCGENAEGLGFDDWLSEVGHPELSADIVNAWQHAQTVADAFPPFSEATPAQIEELYRAVKALTDLLKNDLFGSGSALGFTLPEGVASDTD